MNIASLSLLAAIVSDSRVGGAVARLRHWNFETPTGIAEGYDADSDEAESDASVAATIYSVWRGKMIANTIDATLDGFGRPDVPRPAKREEVVTALKHLFDGGPWLSSRPGTTEWSAGDKILALFISQCCALYGSRSR